jgi:CDP-glycerol glycerophosphotransferase
MADLLLVSDMLITDFSSSAGDFALMNKPVILFQSDKEDYIENSRQLYFSMDSTPYFIAETQDELESIVSGLTDEAVSENCQAILNFYGAYETGKASEVIANRIIEWTK